MVIERDKQELREKLVEILGCNNVFYEIPTKPLSYPCIIFERDDFNLNYADNKIYKNLTKYSVKYLHTSKTNSAEGVIGKIMSLEYTSFNRRYISDGICHDVFTIYY